MARNRKGSDTAVLDAPLPADANGIKTPPPADPTPDGAQPVPQPARTGGVVPLTPEEEANMIAGVRARAARRKPRDPNSVRPIYMLAGQERGTNALRVLMVRPTIGQARKAMADVQQMGGRDYDGYIIFRCKAVE